MLTGLWGKAKPLDRQAVGRGRHTNINIKAPIKRRDRLIAQDIVPISVPIGRDMQRSAADIFDQHFTGSKRRPQGSIDCHPGT